MKRFRTAVIGMGRMGKMRYADAMAHGGFELVAACDADAERLAGCKNAYADWRECIDETSPDAVFVCTFNAAIPEIVSYALSKNISVFSEKPPGRSVDDVLMMKRALDNSSARLKFGFNHRLHNSVMEAKALVGSGLLGEVLCARGVYGKAGAPGFESEWRNDKSISGGGILLDQGIHMLDLLYYFMGEFKSVKSRVDVLGWKGISAEDNAFAILETKDGKTASLHSSATQWKHRFNLELILEDGCITLDGLITSTNSYGEETMAYYRRDLNAKTGRLGRPAEHVLCFTEDSSFKLELQEFYDMLVNDREPETGTIEQAEHLMRVIEDVYGTL